MPDGDVDVLIEVMGCIRDVRTRTEDTDNMFEPFRATVALLKKWDIEVSEARATTSPLHNYACPG